MPATTPPHGLDSHEDRLRRSGRAVSPTEFAALDIRYVDDEIPTRQAIWMRSTAPLPDSPLVHMAVLAYGCDLTLLGTARRPYLEINDPGRFMSASIDHAMWFHRPFRADEWLVHHLETPTASGGRGLGRGRVFTRDGRLVASTVQEGVMRWRTHQ